MPSLPNAMTGLTFSSKNSKDKAFYMGKKVLFIRNIERETPGLALDVLNEMKIPFVMIDAGEAAIAGYPDLSDLLAVVILGGPDSANDKNQKIIAELDFIKKSIDAGIPYLGICLGMQMLVKVCGGQVVKAPEKETAFKHDNGNLYFVARAAGFVDEPLFQNLGDRFRVFQLHGETVELPESVELIGEGHGVSCRNQIVKYKESAYGIQCHFEMNDSLFERLLDEDEDLSRMNRATLVSDFTEISEEYTLTGKTIFKNFFSLCLCK